MVLVNEMCYLPWQNIFKKGELGYLCLQQDFIRAISSVYFWWHVAQTKNGAKIGLR